MSRKHIVPTPTIRSLAFVLIGLLSINSCADRQTFAKEDTLQNFFAKKDVTIAVTDSGLGGLSILADAAERMKTAKIFQTVNFVFYNALFSNEGGYNSLPTRVQKVQVFNSALNSLGKKFSPDLILIGCNTLSVLSDDTPFARESGLPVVGIVDSGVDLIAQSLKAHPESKVILFGTQTTVSEGTYAQKLEQKGFLPERIVSQACPELVSYIEQGTQSDETEMLILAYVDEALQKLDGSSPDLFASLNCTHYGYSLELWEKAFESFGVKPRAFLNPNSRMNDILFETERFERYGNTDITVHVVSAVEIESNRIQSIGSWLQGLSPQTADALRHYTHDPTLFEWKKFVSGK